MTDDRASSWPAIRTVCASTMTVVFGLIGLIAIVDFILG